MDIFLNLIQKCFVFEKEPQNELLVFLNRYYGYTRKASMTHMLMIPLHGFTMTNMLSYECKFI